MSALDDFVAAGPDTGNGARACCKIQPSRTASLRRPASDVVCGVEGHDVGACALPGARTVGCPSAWAPPASAASSSARPVERAGSTRQHVALPVFQPLAVFELDAIRRQRPTQYVGIRADAEHGRPRQQIHGPENAVARGSPRSPGRAPRPAPLLARRGDFSRSRVGGMDQAHSADRVGACRAATQQAAGPTKQCNPRPP